MSRGVMANSSCGLGIALIVYSAWMVWPPLAVASSGVVLCAIGVGLYRSSK